MSMITKMKNDNDSRKTGKHDKHNDGIVKKDIHFMKQNNNHTENKRKRQHKYEEQHITIRTHIDIT